MRVSGARGLGLLAVAVLAGCGTTASNGGLAQSGATPGAKPDVARLETGNYPVQPAPPLGTAADDAAGRRADSQRMAPFVVGPWQVDPAFVAGAPSAGTVVTSAEDVALIIWPFMMGNVARTPPVSGFASDRHTTDKAAPAAVRNAVLRFADDATALAAASGIVYWTTTIPPRPDMTPTLSEPARTMPIPGQPDSTGLLLTYGESGATVRELTVVTAHGPYVFIQVVRSPAGPDAEAELANRVIAQQLPLIDQFTPSDPGRLTAIPLDPTGLVARTLQLPPTEATSMSGAAYPPAGALHSADDPVSTAVQWRDAGVDEVSLGLTTVYQAMDAGHAAALVAAVNDAAAAQPSAEVAAAVPGLPDSRCTRVSDPAGLVRKYQCVAAVDRYVIKSLARDFTKAQQQLAAQYRILSG